MSYLEELLPEFRKGVKIRRKDWDTGRCLYYENGAIYDEHNSHHQLCGFDINSYDWELYKEPIDWDYIIKNKCLCCFWDSKKFPVYGTLKEIDFSNEYLYYNDNVAHFKHCRPVRKDELNFYEEQNKPLYAIGAYDDRFGIYAGMCNGRQVWVAMHDADCSMDWDDAIKYCRDNIFDTHLPTKEELMLIFANKNIIDKSLAENGGEPMKDNMYWSSSECMNCAAWFQSFATGSLSTYNKSTQMSVRPVV